VNSLHYVKTKRDKVGICNICGNVTNLSWDHVPPKGSIICTDVQILSITNNFLEIPNPPREYSQNGMKFRTICANCNNTIGLKFDVVFNNFILKLINLISENIGKEMFLNINVNLEFLIKSIFAHMLAAKGEVENTVPDIKMKECLLDIKEIRDINIHYWFYPYAINQVIRDILIHKIRDGKNALVSILKLYPIAFLVTDSDMFLGEMPRLNDFLKLEGDKETTIKFDLSRLYDYKWPIIVDEDTLIMAGQSIASSVMAVPKLKK